jgi:hypothetical protein
MILQKLEKNKILKKIQKRLQLILEGIGIKELANLDIDFMIYEAENTNLSPETREFIKLSKEVWPFIKDLECNKVFTKARKDRIVELNRKFDRLENDTKTWLNSGTGDKFILEKTQEERESEILLLAKYDEFVVICEKLGISADSANKIFYLLKKYYLDNLGIEFE